MPSTGLDDHDDGGDDDGGDDDIVSSIEMPVYSWRIWIKMIFLASTLN